jgi:hypothetical protein
VNQKKSLASQVTNYVPLPVCLIIRRYFFFQGITLLLVSPNRHSNTGFLSVSHDSTPCICVARLQPIPGFLLQGAL